MNYTPPVSTFLILGRPESGDWQDYVNQYGFTSDHIPELTVGVFFVWAFAQTKKTPS